MNTPAHAVVNLALLGRRDRPVLALPILAGGFAPDLPIVLFYLVEKLRGTPERTIWSERYFEPGPQVLADIGHAFPLLLLAVVATRALGAIAWCAFFASMTIHSLIDLPLHHDDAHRHFWPLSDWRWSSPVSYWDPAHGGHVMMVIEALLVVALGALLWRRYSGRGVRLALVSIGAIYLLFFGFAAWMWMGFPA